MRIRTSLVATAIASIAAVGLTACSGGASDTVGGPAQSNDGSGGVINLYSYSITKGAFDAEAAAFNKTDAGKNVTFQASYGPSGDQSRKVEKGAAADYVLFSLEPDVTRLVKADLVDATWADDANKGIPAGSVVTLVVRKGNPKNIKDWDDLLKSDVEVVTPNPFSSGGAKWNLLAPYAVKSEGGKNPQAGLDYIKDLVTNHVKVQPKSAREATEAFLQGQGDVLISYEAEAIASEKNGDPVEHINPASTFKIENPGAVLKTSKNLEKAKAFRDFLFSKDGQRVWAKSGFRPVDPSVLAEFSKELPSVGKLWTIADLGGWKKVNDELFAEGTGSIAQIYDAATK
ncbi:MAG: sulfate ABC transporter substrate-binding protein [Nocardiaceae bacterium]|nr:sulfate ABC transporter substrate-binding protein [Nocardiaceae bacterium]